MHPRTTDYTRNDIKFVFWLHIYSPSTLYDGLFGSSMFWEVLHPLGYSGKAVCLARRRRRNTIDIFLNSNL